MSPMPILSDRKLQEIFNNKQEIFNNKNDYKSFYSNDFYERMADEDLIAACQNKNVQAFEQLIKRYDALLNARIYRYVPDVDDRKDIRQEALIKIWQSIGMLRNHHAFRVWLHRLVTHLAYDYLGQQSRMRCISLDEIVSASDGKPLGELEISDNSRVPDRLCEDRELALELRKAIAQLPRHFREAIVLRELHGYSYEAISNKTGTEIGTVKSRISRARDKVRSQLDYYLKMPSSSRSAPVNTADGIRSNSTNSIRTH